MLRWVLLNSEAHSAAEKAGIAWAGPEQPEFHIGLEEWYADFIELSTDRQIGMAEGPIPKSSIDAHVSGWPDDIAQMFRECMRAMDTIYRKPRKDLIEPVEKTGEELLRSVFGGLLDA